MSDREQEALRAQIAENLGQKLLRAARLFNQQAIEEVATRGHALREAHTRLFPYLELEGVRLTDLARRAGITKQSTQQLVDELVDGSYLTRRPDPEDGRAKLIAPTRKGLRAVTAGLGALDAVEARVKASVGARDMKALEQSLDRLLDALG